MYKYARKQHAFKCTNTVNNVHLVRNSSHMAKFFQYITDCRLEITKTVMGSTVSRISRLTQFIHATLKILNNVKRLMA